jgi:D-alanine-D-alanine ligase
MRIGLVYDLRDEYRALGHPEAEIASFDRVETIDAIADALDSLGYDVERIGRGQQLAARLSVGKRYDLVFSLARGLKGRSREAQVPAVCEMFDQPYLFSDPLTLAACLDKETAKRLVREAGVPTADFTVAYRGASDVSGWKQFPAFVKPLAEGAGKGCEASSVVETPAQLAAAVKRTRKNYQQPALVETYLPGREFTVGIVGNGIRARVLGVCEITIRKTAAENVASPHRRARREELLIHRRVDDLDPEAGKAIQRALTAYRTLQCRDAARMDFRSDGSRDPHFLEANPLPALNPQHSDLPMLAALHRVPFVELVGMIMDAGLARYGLAPPSPERRSKTA